MTIPRTFRVLAAAALLTTGACAADDGSTATAASSATAAAQPADGVTVDVKNIAFSPAEVRVLRSTEVTWTNLDAGVLHTVTSGTGGTNPVPGVSEGEPNEPDGTFNGELSEEGSFSYTFSEAGTFSYFCEIHPSMRGTVVVE